MYVMKNCPLAYDAIVYKCIIGGLSKHIYSITTAGTLSLFIAQNNQKRYRTTFLEPYQIVFIRSEVTPCFQKLDVQMFV